MRSWQPTTTQILIEALVTFFLIWAPKFSDIGAHCTTDRALTHGAKNRQYSVVAYDSTGEIIIEYNGCHLHCHANCSTHRFTDPRNVMPKDKIVRKIRDYDIAADLPPDTGDGGPCVLVM